MAAPEQDSSSASGNEIREYVVRRCQTLRRPRAQHLICSRRRTWSRGSAAAPSAGGGTPATSRRCTMRTCTGNSPHLCHCRPSWTEDRRCRWGFRRSAKHLRGLSRCATSPHRHSILQPERSRRVRHRITCSDINTAVERKWPRRLIPRAISLHQMEGVRIGQMILLR